MTLTIDGQVIKHPISNDVELVQNQYISRARNLTGGHISRRLAITDKKTETISLQTVSQTDFDFLIARNGTDLACSLAGVGDHNFSGTYNLELPNNVQKSYNETQNFTITLHRV